MTDIAIVIPARGGSIGVPRKNLRPFGGQPLLAWSIEAAKAVSNARVIVSTDDDEIALLAKRLGADVDERPSWLAEPDVPVDDVVAHVAAGIDPQPSVIVTVQPTAPFVTAVDIEKAVQILLRSAADTVVAVTPDKHLRWRRTDDGRVIPQYESRVNRQWLPDEYRETGAVTACRRSLVTETGTRFGTNVALVVIPPERALDIDTSADFRLGQALLATRKIAIRTIGSSSTGLGHVYRCLSLAHDLVGHDVVFHIDKSEHLAEQLIRGDNYPLQVHTSQTELTQALAESAPDLIINDALNTDVDLGRALSDVAPVVTFEDEGPGAMYAELVVNALLPDPDGGPDSALRPGRVLRGMEYIVLRDEFVTAPRYRFEAQVGRVLITFGGVDESNLTIRSVAALEDVLAPGQADVDVVVGPGYAHREDLEAKLARAKNTYRLVRQTRSMSEFMRQADLCITSGGRTVFEAASLGVPVVSIAQNSREMSHRVGQIGLGVLTTGRKAADVSDDELRSLLRRAIEDRSWRDQAHVKSLECNLLGGRARVRAELSRLLTSST